MRLAVTFRDQGEQPVRLRFLMDEAEAALGTLTPEGWQLVTLQLMRRRLARELKGWAGAIDYRARMLRQD